MNAADWGPCVGGFWRERGGREEWSCGIWEIWGFRVRRVGVSGCDFGVVVLRLMFGGGLGCSRGATAFGLRASDRLGTYFLDDGRRRLTAAGLLFGPKP